MVVMINSINSTCKHSMGPFLRWAGSKRQLMPILSEYWKPSYSRYVEPFAGSASLFFYLAPKKALLADINQELIGTYRQVKNNYDQVVKSLRCLRKGRQEYLRLRSINPKSISPTFRAARFIYLNRFCFNGLYRTNRKGLFNVPYSGDRTGRLPSPEHFAVYAKKLRNAKLLHASFDETLKQVRHGDFVYMDPPFAVKGRRIFNEYDATSFGACAIEKLRKWLTILDCKGISFLVSYADSDEARFLAAGFSIKAVTVKRNIAGFANSRKTDAELLIFN